MRTSLPPRRLLLPLLLTTQLLAQTTGEIRGLFTLMAYDHASGVRHNPSAQTLIQETHQIAAPGAPSLRVIFGSVALGPGDYLEVQSMADGSTHRLTSNELAKWSHTSAFFNGDTLLVNLVVAPSSSAAYEITGLLVGTIPLPVETICGTDDRTPSYIWRSLRFVSSTVTTATGCTIWTADAADGMVTAGHCIGPYMVAEAWVPGSLPNGAIQHPLVRWQWPVATASAISVNGGPGDDWAMLRVLPNVLGEYPAQIFGHYDLGFRLPAAGSTLRVTGYGSDDAGENGTNQTDTGPYQGSSGTSIQYVVDTNPGNSGSAIVDEYTGQALGIHTNGYCTTLGYNSGTSLTNAGFRSAWETFSNVTPPAFDKVMITEVSWGDPDGLEITNFGPVAVDLTGWAVKWRDDSANLTSAPLNVVIAPGEIIVIKEASGSIAGIPQATQVLSRFGAITTTDSAITVALVDSLGAVIDEVRITNAMGDLPGWSFGGNFRGMAHRGFLSGTTGDVGVERIWGLDSDGGTDWSDQPDRSFGRENRSTGPRGPDPILPYVVWINEVDDDPDYVELLNPWIAPVELHHWFLLCSPGQGLPHVRISPFPNPTFLNPGEFLVIGDGPAPPPEMPAGTQYVDLSALGGSSLPWGPGPYDCALYDHLGRLVDLMRTTGHDDVQVHNHPRAPAHWSDFAGAAGRSEQTGSGGGSVAHTATYPGTHTGADWRPSYLRTMGSPNANFAAGPGHGDVYDVRLNEGVGEGLTIILNAGPANAGATYSFLLSVGHSYGRGPVFGLGPDAILNFLLLYGVPPWTGTLDAQGSARIDLDPGVLPPGVALDTLFLLQTGSGLLSARTLALAFDT